MNRGVILPIVLLILVFLGLLAGSFSFYVMATRSAAETNVERVQTRLAAEAGLQRVFLLLRTERNDVNKWYDNRDAFRQAVVWSTEGGAESFGASSTEELPPGARTYRFSIVADDPADDESKIRYGLTDEASKINLNAATPDQIRALLAYVVAGSVDEIPVEELVDAFLDWRDPDSDARPNGAEQSYYDGLQPPYLAKNGSFETVEELLLVKGFTARLLYGEDYDRNGLLSVNEDDGEESFPLDNADGKLDRGLLPYITVYSGEFNTASDNKPRLDINSAAAEKLAEFLDQSIVDFIMAARTAGTVFSTVSQLLGLVVGEGENEQTSPVTVQDMPTLLDRCTATPSPRLAGLIDINTAPKTVLTCIPGITGSMADAIMSTRGGLGGDVKSTTAWLLTEGIVTPEQFQELESFITSRSLQYTIESIGFADHTGAFTRLQVIVDMKGPVAQTLYYRDLTRLGIGYPVRADEEEESSFSEKSS